MPWPSTDCPGWRGRADPSMCRFVAGKEIYVRARQTNGKSIVNRCSPVDAAQARRHEEALEIAKHAVQSADAILDHLEAGDFAFKPREKQERFRDPSSNREK